MIAPIPTDVTRLSLCFGQTGTIMPILLDGGTLVRHSGVIRNDRAERSRMQEGMGADVRARRRDLGLTQQAAADLAGVSERFVRQVETGKKTVRLDKLTDLLEALGLELRAQVRR